MKKILFIVVVLLLASTVTFAKSQGPGGKPGSQGASQSQCTYMNVSHGVVISGYASGSFGAGGSTSASQGMATKGGWAAQSNSSSVYGGGILKSLCGWVSSCFSGTTITYQTQSLPSGGGGMPPR
jgi:hypothetical protein